MVTANVQNRTKTKWVHTRHKIVRAVLYWPFYIYVMLRYRIRIEKVEKGKHRQYCVLYNHQTACDQFFVHLAFRDHIYHVASEDLFSAGWISRLLEWVVAPIPFRKSTADISGVKNCIRVAREGGSVALSPEGNRTYSGTTEYMKSSVASLVRKMGMPLALLRIEGGYGAHPRWSDTVRKGKMRAYVARIVEPEEYSTMTNEALFELIKQVLYVDEREDKNLFYGRGLAEYLDRVMYVCPTCGLSEFHSEGDIISCKQCGKQIRYLPSKELQGVNGDFPFPYVKQWYDYQCDFIRRLDLNPFREQPVYRDAVSYRESIYCRKKKMLDETAVLSVFADRFEVDTKQGTVVYPFASMFGATVLGRNKLNLYIDGKTYQFVGSKHFNAVKYLNLYHHGIHKESDEPEFLGL